MRGKTVQKASDKMALPAAAPPHRSRVREYLAIVILAAAVFLMVCLLSYDPRDPSFNVVTHRAGVSNLGGLVGSYVADALVQMVGLSALFVPLALVVLAARLAVPPLFSQKWTAVCSTLVLLSVVAALMERSQVGSVLGVAPAHAGGTIGAFLHTSFFKFFGRVGEIIVGCTLILLSVLHILRISLKRCVRFTLWVVTRPVLLVMSAWWKLKDGLTTWRLRRMAAALADPPSICAYTDSVDVDGLTAGIWPVRDAYPCGPPEEAALDVPWEKVPIFPRGGSDARANGDESGTQEETSLANRPSKRDRIAGGLRKRSESAATSARQVDMPQAPEPAEPSQDVSQAIPDADSEGTPPERFKPPVTAAPGHDSRDQDQSDAAEVPVAQESSWRPLQIVEATGEGLPQDTAYHSPQDLEAAIEEYLRGETPERQATPKKLAVLVPAPALVPSSEPPRPIRVTKRADEQLAAPAHPLHNASSSDDYVLPPTDLLDTRPASSRAVDEQLLERNAAILEQKLADLGIRGEVVEIHPGPVITMYEVILAAGIPLRKVLNTSDDLAMALKSGSTRVVAPIPGKDTVGIEVPNLHREIVYFREIIESSAFIDLTAPLKVALGKGIDGTPFATSLVRMPHLLIAGATGTGKSVGLNGLICSWLMSCSPDDVKFLMVDPKRLELSHYQDIPHLIHPVVTEPEKVPKVLSWAIREMERRYEMLSKTGAKNIESYNQKLAAMRSSADPHTAVPDKLPYIVIIVDELAELMMVAAKDIEISIARLAQMARASGIHLILATQRPSVDVITGVIKANFPARLSYQVSAKPDSRTILDCTGAEHLLGMGDMLFLPPGSAKLTRLHGAYVSEDEIRNIVDFVKAQRAPVYSKEIENHVAEVDSTGAAADLLDDPKYDEALELVTRLGHASISLIQRHMRIGYNRAARIIEAMESEGIIGPSDGTSRPREVRAQSLDSIPDSAPF